MGRKPRTATVQARRRLPGRIAAVDFIYAFHLPKKGKATGDWTAGPFQQITGYPADTLEKSGWDGLIYPKDKPLPERPPRCFARGP